MRQEGTLVTADRRLWETARESMSFVEWLGNIQSGDAL